ncbi:hypothetical protein QUF80_11750 [Desulfococcaceae bacterium HSG8]|nr:hypothetical protein [Desulfococcaceae bacterium HSG8]
MIRFIKITAVLIASGVFGVTVMAWSNEPTALLLQVKGTVEFRNGAKEWKQVNRNKFLFNGYQVRTGGGGSCKLLNQQTNTIRVMQEDSEVEIGEAAVKLIKGKLSEGQPSVDFIGNLKRKFAKVQKYTVVLRSVRKGISADNSSANPIKLSEDYPDLVWENAGPGCSYRLVVGEKVFDIPPADGDMVRFRLKQLNPGQSDYRVQVIRNGIPEPGNRGTLRWMTGDESEAFRKGLKSIQEIDPDNGFLMGNYMDEQGLRIAAMDQYLTFFNKNPNANEMRPFLIKIYNDLKLKKLERKEINFYNSRIE